MKLTPQLGDHPYCCTSATAFQSEIPSKPPSLSKLVPFRFQRDEIRRNLKRPTKRRDETGKRDE